MRWLASLFALGLMMALFRHVTAGAPLEARATLALGFLLLVAYVGGELARRAPPRPALPRITGYLLAAFAVGPAWLGLVRRDEIDALGLIADAAAALVALAAGFELRLATLTAGARRGVARLALGAIGAPLVAVTLVVLSVSARFPVSIHQPFGDAVAVALVLGVLAAASSPVITRALTHEVDARGASPTARTLLAVSVVQDLAVVLLFALALAVAKPLASAGTLNLRVAATALAELAGSLALGAAAGFMLDQVLRRVSPARVSPGLAVLVALATAGVAGLLHVGTPIIALAMGFYLGNFAPAQGERLRLELQRALAPATVVLFALAGAGMRLGVLADLWPWALLLVGLRAVGLRAGLNWAGRDPSVTPVLARDGWLGLISQGGGGTVLGLAQLARRAFPEWGVSLETLIVAIIGVHAIAGPICLRLALGRSGEVTEEGHDAEARVVHGSGGTGGDRVAARGGVL
jgi:Kef-type K+ transport system membrane component KefB